ncbi:MAG: tetrahydrofolate dehydrogenase/cyclohydrolase catalytic domain-containing protein [Patescibacteria group bacterium]
MKIFNGKKEANKILRELKDIISKENLTPHLAVILIGNDKPSHLYVDLKRKAAESIGVGFSLYEYSSAINEDLILDKIEEINNDKSIQGVIIQLPLPFKFNILNIISKIDPRKDVDGFHQKNIDAIKLGKPIIKPVLPNVIFCILNKAYKRGFDKKRVKALVNSDLFGEILKNFLFFENINVEILVDKKYSAKKISEFTKDADILISVLGRPNIIKSNMLKEKTILIDAGIKKKGKIVYGDIDFKNLDNKAVFVTPVPGGVGPMTVAMLLKNVVDLSRY